MITIGIVDNHSVMRHGIRSWLEAECDFSIIAETGKGEEAMQIVEHQRPAILILNLHLPNVDGIQMIRHITIHSPQTRILALTGYDIQLIVSAINAGANGCLLRDEERETLIAAVRWTAQHSEGAWLNPAISKSILSIQLNAQKAELTNAETEVVRLLNRRNKLIADHLCISERTVRNYVSTIYSKLNVHSRYEAIEWARTHGYL